MSLISNVLTLKSINIEWAKKVSLKEFKIGLAYYQHQDLDAFYNEINGIVIKKAIDGVEFPPQIAIIKTIKNNNANRKSNTKTNTKN